jgi:hypothetical protein
MDRVSLKEGVAKLEKVAKKSRALKPQPRKPSRGFLLRLTHLQGVTLPLLPSPQQLPLSLLPPTSAQDPAPLWQELQSLGEELRVVRDQLNAARDVTIVRTGLTHVDQLYSCTSIL